MGHTIMAMVGSEIIKVECRICKSVHRYRPPARVGGAAAVTMKKGRDGEPISIGGTPTQSSRPVAPKAGRRPSAALAAAEAWRSMARKHEGETPRAYSMAESFAVGEYIEHPSFGLGEVAAAIPPDKVDILFEMGMKRLLCNKA
ncbi:MAG: hypothetical protein LBV01_05130 [Deltaproteobacteria bacterium]|jgi:hypothetical protein|nr:hypothetical protein [Deltaproteobacteria bacterium]